MMKNKLIDLNNHLFAQLERLSDEDVKGDQLKEELERSKAITNIGREIISNASLVLKAKELQLEYGIKEKMPEMLEDKTNA